MTAFAAFVTELVHGVVRELASAPDDAVRRRADQVRAAVEPPPGVWLDAPDGVSYTGFVFVDRNRPVIMLCVRHEPPPRRWSRPAPWSDSSQLPFWEDGSEE